MKIREVKSLKTAILSRFKDLSEVTLTVNSFRDVRFVKECGKINIV